MNEVAEIVIRGEAKQTSSAGSLYTFPAWQLIPEPILVRKPREKEVGNRSIYLPKIEIMGIPFLVKREDGETVLESERWPSLRASGPKVQNAIEEMRSLLHDVIEEYVLSSEETLSDDAKEFRYYLISTVI